MIDRAEKAGLGLSFAAHAALLAALSFGLFAAQNRMPIKAQSMDVQFVDEVGLSAAAPVVSPEAPAASEAPEQGRPEEAPPPPSPALAPAEPTPAPPTPAPQTPAPVKAAAKPAPAPKPSPKPVPAKPAAAQPAKAAPAKPLGADFLKGVKAEARSEGRNAAATGKRTTGAKLGQDFLKGIAGAREGKAATATAAVSGAAMASLGAAIKRQVQPCYNLGSLGGTPAMQIVTVLQLRFNRDGSVAGTPQLVEQQGINGGNSAYARQMLEVSRRAILQCAPLKLPANLYEGGWQNIIMGFIPGQMQ